jgi:regulator of nucleoside diphosphate kinase
MNTEAYALAIRLEQLEKAISVAVVAKFNRLRMSLEDSVEAAIEQVFCPCVSHHESVGEMPSTSIRAGIFGSIVGYLRERVCTARAGHETPCGDWLERGAETGLPPKVGEDAAISARRRWWTEREEIAMSPNIFVTTVDAARLSRVLEVFGDSSYAPLTGFLQSELRRAVFVEPRVLPQTIVTMNSRVRFRLDGSGEPREATLACPGREDGLLGRISVLTPVGSALLGMREGETNTWNGLDGRRRTVTVLKVLYQPEAHGVDLGGESSNVGKCGCLSG